MTDLVKLRADVKKRKPNFRRQDSHKKKRISRTGYRRSRGLQSKVRLGLKGYVKKVNVGYGGPAEAKGLDRTGLMPFLIENVSQLEKIDSKTEGALISSGVGLRKRLSIIEKAKEMKIKVLNVKDVDSFTKDAKSMLEQRKEERSKNKLKKQKKEQKKTKKSDKEDKQSDNELTDDEKKAHEKDEKDKVLTKKE